MMNRNRIRPGAECSVRGKAGTILTTIYRDVDDRELVRATDGQQEREVPIQLLDPPDMASEPVITRYLPLNISASGIEAAEWSTSKEYGDNTRGFVVKKGDDIRLERV